VSEIGNRLDVNGTDCSQKFAGTCKGIAVSGDCKASWPRLGWGRFQRCDSLHGHYRKICSWFVYLALKTQEPFKVSCILIVHNRFCSSYSSDFEDCWFNGKWHVESEDPGEVVSQLLQDVTKCELSRDLPGILTCPLWRPWLLTQEGACRNVPDTHTCSVRRMWGIPVVKVSFMWSDN
jgi:hypothetical protein